MKKLSVASALLALIFATGCASTKVAVKLDDSMLDKSIEVHLIGISDSEKSQFDNMSMTDYWGEDSQGVRSSNESRVIGYQAGLNKQVPLFEISSDNSSWKQWQSEGAKYVMVLVNMPASRDYEDAPGNADARRLRLPLNKACWKGGVVDVVIRGYGIATGPNYKTPLFCDCELDD